jgi:hypothetical protein
MSARSTKTPFKYMSNFKAVAADWEYFASLSDEGELYCLSEQQIYVILVQMEYVGWLTRWYNTEDINQTTVDRVKSDIMEALMSCVDVSILVDQANDNLITATVNRAIQSQALRDILDDRYDGTPTSINPDAPTTNFGISGDRYDALCAGLMAFVYQFARAQADSVRAGQVGGLAAIALIAALLIPGLNIFFLVGASIAVLIGLGTVGVTTEIAIQALTDTEALDNVVCCMRENLRFDTVSEANWLTALNACSFAVGSHEQIVADFLLPTLADNYLTILNILGQAYTGVVNGEQLPECPCEPPPAGCLTGHFQNFRLNNGGFTPYVSRGTYVPGQGWTIGGVGTSPARIGIWAVVTPHATSIKLVTSGNVDAVRINKSTGGVIGTLLGSDSFPVVSAGEYTWEIPVLGVYTGDEIMFDIGGSGNYSGIYVRSFCWNY